MLWQASLPAEGTRTDPPAPAGADAAAVCPGAAAPGHRSGRAAPSAGFLLFCLGWVFFPIRELSTDLRPVKVNEILFSTDLSGFWTTS